MSRERFQDALWYKKAVKFIIGGSGGIGSWIAFFLTRAGFYVDIYDFDLVEEHNLGGQLFFADSIGKPKVKALTDVICQFNGNNFELNAHDKKIDDNTYFPQSYYGHYIFISAFDNMTAREKLFNKFTQFYSNKSINNKIWFVDGRLLMEQMRIYNISSEDQKAIHDYIENHLFPDSDVEEAPCTMKQVSHSAAMIATHMMGFITNIIANEFEWKDSVFRVPYIWDYIIPSNQITEKYGYEL